MCLVFAQDDYTVKIIEVLQTVGHYQHRAAAVGKCSEQPHEALLSAAVEAACGFIEQQKPGFVDQFGRNPHSLLLAAAQVVIWPVPIAGLQVDFPEN